MKTSLFLSVLAALVAATVQQECTPDSKSLPVAGNCNSFKVCGSDKTFREFNCGTNQYFDADTSSCKKDTDNKCAVPGCDLDCGIHGKCGFLTDGAKTCYCNSGYHGSPCVLVTGTATATGCSCVRGSCTLREDRPYCLCPDGYAGAHCEKKTTSLTCTKLCKNRGSCVLVDREMRCACQAGFVGNECEIYANKCADKNCGKGKCTIIKDVPTCQCDRGYIGDNCDKESKCVHYYCANGGTCLEPAGTPTCICHEGFTGNHCQYKQCGITTCVQGDCSADKKTCVCKTGWKGHHCDTVAGTPTQGEIGLCRFITCQNGGKCVLNEGKPTCNCPAKFTGQFCLDAVVEPDGACKNLKCQNGGKCVEKAAGELECECATGFTGSVCSERIEKDCHLDCQNGGTCKNLGNGNFECDCKEGYSGTICTEKVSCDGLTCMFGGECHIVENAPACKCTEGTTGDRCQYKTHCLADNKPCKNGAQCINSDIGWTCICKAPYFGARCETATQCANTYLQCTNGGVCEDNPNAVCNCPEGFQGPTCATPKDDCGGCQNGGVCLESPVQNPLNNGPKPSLCFCPVQYTGLYCEESVVKGKELYCPLSVGLKTKNLYMVYPFLEDREMAQICHLGKIARIEICKGELFDPSTNSCMTTERYAEILEKVNAAYTAALLA